MAFYLIEEDGSFLTWKLSGGNARFHFYLFRFYSIFLMLLGIFCGWILYLEEPNSYLWVVGILTMIPGIIMLNTRYPLSIQFGKEFIINTTKNVFKGEHSIHYSVSEMSCLQYEYRYGKYGGLIIELKPTSGATIKLAKIPWIRLNKERAIEDLRKLAAFSGLPLNEV